MKVVIAEVSHPLAGKVSLVARRVRVDAVRTNKKHIGQKDMLDPTKDVPDGKQLQVGMPSNELAAVVDLGRRSKDLVRMKTADCMPEHLAFFVREAHKEIASRMAKMNLTKYDHDMLFVVEDEDPQVAFQVFAEQLKRSKHMP
jgi:hypothetical protein